MNPETNPYIPAAGSRPPALVGREDELDTFTVALGRLGKGIHARSMILDGVRGVGKTVPTTTGPVGPPVMLSGGG